MLAKELILMAAFCLTVTMAPENVADMVHMAGEETMTVQEQTVQEPEQDATIKRPENYVDPTFYDRLVFVGDSRTVGMRDALGGQVQTDTVWSCKSAMGYDWMTGTGIPQVEEYITDNTAVIILMGVNDPANISNYVNYVNNKAQEWSDRGADTYYAALGPVNGAKYVSNEQIEAFNASLQSSLIGVDYLDVYDHMLSVGYTTTDGVHYSADTYRDIYQYIVDNLECDNGGIPGSIWG